MWQLAALILAEGMPQSFTQPMSNSSAFVGRPDVIGNSVLFVSTLSILSPVLGTLTQTYADDTIRALGILFGLIHLLSHNYTYIDSGIGRFVP